MAITRDGVPVLMHDDDLDRTTNGTGRVADIDYAQLRQLNAVAKFRGEKCVFTLARTEFDMDSGQWQ